MYFSTTYCSFESSRADGGYPQDTVFVQAFFILSGAVN